MKKTITTFLCCLSLSYGYTQNIDSFLAAPQIVALEISTPEPRLEETFQLTLDINHLRANIFRSLIGKISLSQDISLNNEGVLTLNINALKKGQNEIGPLEFYINKTKYTTNKITFNVIDPLPKVDKGLWFRKVKTGDSTFSIIIEQRIPAVSKKTTNADGSITFAAEPEYKNVVELANSIDGAESATEYSHLFTGYGSVEINGETRQYMCSYNIYSFTIIDKKKKIKITKSNFKYLPDNFVFEDIIVQ